MPDSKPKLQVCFLIYSSGICHIGIRVQVLQMGKPRPGEERNLLPSSLVSQDLD